MKGWLTRGLWFLAGALSMVLLGVGFYVQAMRDRLFLGAAGAIFADDFESGDTTAWSSCSGCAP